MTTAARLTKDLPGTGGSLKTAPEDFVVEELPAYAPSGVGPHTLVQVEKRGLTTEEALQRICRALGVPRDAAGAAGMKDRQAVTRQWLSFPDVDPAAAQALALPGITVLAAARHGNKLRTGHLRGNRFSITLRGLGCPVDEAVARARAVLARLVSTGLPNRFGAQRFGRGGDNAERGRALVTGAGGARRMARGERRLYVSALQSELFNHCLDARLNDGLLRSALLGDLLRKRDTGGLFACQDVAEAQARLDAGALDVTGPMFGHKMMAPPQGSPAGAREQAILAGSGITIEQLAALGPIAEGTRRPYTVPIEDAAAEPGAEPETLLLRFSLPSGAYATVLVDEVSKNP
jgi:tRNA pseudouridine13 synthase